MIWGGTGERWDWLQFEKNGLGDGGEQLRQRILLVTSALDMRRIQHLFERQDLQVLPFPVDFQARGRWVGHILA